MFRDFAKQDKKYLRRNNLKRLKQVRQRVQSEWESHSPPGFCSGGMTFILSIDYAAGSWCQQDEPVKQGHLSAREKYLYKHFDKLTV